MNRYGRRAAGTEPYQPRQAGHHSRGHAAARHRGPRSAATPAAARHRVHNLAAVAQHHALSPGVPGHHIPRSGANNARCNICSYSQSYPTPQIPIYHRHFSSIRFRELAGIKGNYLCPTCMSRHQLNPEPRTKLVISDSTLHEFFGLHENELG